MHIVAAKWAVCAVVTGRRSLPVIAALAAVSAVFLSASTLFAVAQSKASPSFWPSPLDPIASLETTIEKVRVGRETYGIPRNYIRSLGQNSETNGVSLWAILPDISPMTQASRHCFIDRRDPCNSEIVDFVLQPHRSPITASSQIRNAKNLNLWKTEKKAGACDLEYFEDNVPTERTGQGFNFFIGNALGSADLPLLRCPKENAAAYRPLCNSSANLDDTNSFYYIFNRANLCEWPGLAEKIIGLVRIFREQGARQ